MTLREIVSDIRSSFKWNSSDNPVTDRFIASELRKESILLIKREIDKRKLYSSDSIFTEIPCLEMEEVPLSECCGYNSYPCSIARSKKKLPKVGEAIYGIIAQGVYSIDGKKRFDYMDPDRYSNYLNMYPDKKDKMFVFWKRNGYLYINQPDIQLVKFIAFFEEDVPKELFSCSGEDVTCPDNPLDIEFKCPGYLIPNVKKLVRNTIRETFKSSIEDTQEDDKDDSR